MSRSYRRPFAAITGTASAKDDKRLANRGVRRKQNLAVKTCADFEVLFLPHRLECTWNNTYCWGRDGGQCFWRAPDRSAASWEREHFQKLLRK